VVVEDTNLGETNPPRYDDLPDKPCDAPSPFSKKYTSDDPTGLDLNLSLDITHVTRNATVVRVLADRVVQLEVKLTGRNAVSPLLHLPSSTSNQNFKKKN
jgi:hypothetical protein